jgi:uncharacterized protein (DUF433 family)
MSKCTGRSLSAVQKTVKVALSLPAFLVLNGKLRVRGARVSVGQILELPEAGVTQAEIVQSFPSISESDVAAVERLAAHYALATLQSV